MTNRHEVHVCDGPPCSQCQAMLDSLPNTQAGRFAIIGLLDGGASSVTLPTGTTACALDDITGEVASVAIGVKDPGHPNRAHVAVITEPSHQKQGYGFSAVEALGEELINQGVDEIKADINMSSNLASRNLAKKLGQEAKKHGVRTIFSDIFGR